ncbi:hypothetical protein [Altericista sp. CCNU0014]|uniref:hypothetical protein n=1 Tax=Altericista sp. CCNU0014 TaxID=3082949 RepID=UPI003850EAAB
MAIILCPGIHDPALTLSFWDAIQSVKLPGPSRAALPRPYIFPDARHWAFSSPHVLQFLHQSLPIAQPLVLLGFSAGVVGAIGAAWAWQQQGGTVRALVAVDGWGVPLYGTFPIYRLSHDGFTHWSSQGWGMGRDPFYADPGVPHLELWRSPDRAWGWWDRGQRPQRTNAAVAIARLLARYEGRFQS